MACNANTSCVNVRKACNKLNCTIDAHSTIVKFCNRQAFRVAMTVQIKCQHHISPASQLNTIQVLHFFVVIPSFDCNNTRRRCVFGCILWNVKVCGQLVSRGTFPFESDFSVIKMGTHCIWTIQCIPISLLLGCF